MSEPQTSTPAMQLPAAFEFRLSKGLPSIRETLADVVQHLESLGLEVEETSAVQLVLAEVLNNIFEHAYVPDASCGAVHIRCSPARDGLHLQVRDMGQPLPGHQLPPALPPKVDVDLLDLPEGGFGWFIIQDLAKDVRYRREAGENLLDLRMAVGPMGPH